MTDEFIAITLLAVLGAVSLMATAAIAYLFGRRFKQRSLAIFLAGSVAPLAMLAAAFYGVATDGPDGTAPGNVLMGAFLGAAILTPITLLASWLTLRHAHRAALGRKHFD
jgi:hypothetical protein